MIKRDWLRYYDEVPERTYYAKMIQSWDTAAKDGARTTGRSAQPGWLSTSEFYLLDLTRGRYEYPQLRDIAVALAERFSPDEILIEEASTGIALAQEMNQARNYHINPIPVGRDPDRRIYVQQAKFAAGRVHFPRGAPFWRSSRTELLAFPQARTDTRLTASAKRWRGRHVLVRLFAGCDRLVAGGNPPLPLRLQAFGTHFAATPQPRFFLRPDHKMLIGRRTTPQDCSRSSARLPMQTERVWWHFKQRYLPWTAPRSSPRLSNN